MLIDTLKKANSVMLDSVQNTKDKQAAKTFKEQVVELSKCTPQLEHLLKVIDTLREKELSTDILTSESKESLQTAVDNCGEKIYNHTLDVATVIALRNSVEFCRSTTEIAWKKVAEAQSSSVMDSLNSLKGLLEDKKEADDLLEELENARVKMPASVKAIEYFLTKVNRGKEIVDGLHLDDEVEIFIKKVRMQSATINDLTPHIMEWIKVNKLTTTMKVRF